MKTLSTERLLQSSSGIGWAGDGPMITFKSVCQSPNYQSCL